MGRYRPPQPKSSPYITRQGYERLRAESEDLWKKRRRVTIALAAAAAEGDRSENAEYIYRKKQLREIDRRIRYLQTRLPRLKIVDASPADPARVFFGAWVTLEDDKGKEACYRIVGADEFDSKQNWISVDAPLARGLLGKALDTDVDIVTPSGKQRFLIVEIRYQ